MSRQYLDRARSGYRGINALLAVLLPTAAAAAPINAVAASLTTTLTGANNDMVFTAKTKGVIGNDITIAYINPATPNAALSVGVVGKAITVNLATGAGTPQVETATAVGTITQDGNATVVVTGAGITGSPITLSVAVLNNDTAATWAGKVRTALAANAAITALYTVGGTGAAITLTRIVATANDSTLNISLDNGTCTGITTAASSANTTPGVAPAITSTAAQVKTAIEASSAANALVALANSGGDSGAGAVTALTATPLANGVDGTVGDPWEQLYYANYLYLVASDDGNTIADANWVKVAAPAA